jgi:hypothetical protein
MLQANQAYEREYIARTENAGEVGMALAGLPPSQVRTSGTIASGSSLVSDHNDQSLLW